MNIYLIAAINKNDYDNLTNYLAQYCDSYALVEPHADSYDFPDELPPIKMQLEQYLISRKRIVSWPGTKMKVKYDREKAVEHIYRCCKNSMKVFNNYNSFFEIEWDIDAAFYKEKKCVLWMIAHEGMMFVDLNFFGTFFDNTQCKLLKEKTKSHFFRL
jgi:hypothetical protein